MCLDLLNKGRENKEIKKSRCKTRPFPFFQVTKRSSLNLTHVLKRYDIKSGNKRRRFHYKVEIVQKWGILIVSTSVLNLLWLLIDLISCCFQMGTDQLYTIRHILLLTLYQHRSPIMSFLSLDWNKLFVLRHLDLFMKWETLTTPITV